jgi:NADH-quinone oxidoreductase subunit G
MVMDAANKLGTYIPHFCYHKKLSIAANCRMCLVEVEKAPKPLPACATPGLAGMIVRSHSDKAVQAQKSVMEFLLINHPLDCPICDQGGECQLQDLAVGYGKSESRYDEEKRVVPPKEAGPLISMEEMTRCIQCTRCVRFGQEVAGVMEFGMLGRGEHSEITTFVGKTVDSEVSGNMIDLCPVGALTSKPFRYRPVRGNCRAASRCRPHDSLGTNLIVQVKGGKVMRVLPLENERSTNAGSRTRTASPTKRWTTPTRLTNPMIKQGGQWQETDWQTALEYVAHGLRNIRHEHGADSIAAVGDRPLDRGRTALLKSHARHRRRERRLPPAPERLRAGRPGRAMAGHADRRTVDAQACFVVGSFLRKDHRCWPRAPARRRQGRRQAVDRARSADDNLIPTANKPDRRAERLAGRAVGNRGRRRRAKGVALPAGFENVEATGRCQARSPPPWSSTRTCRALSCWVTPPRTIRKRRKLHALRSGSPSRPAPSSATCRSGQHRRRLPGQWRHRRMPRSCSPSRRKPTCC